MMGRRVRDMERELIDAQRMVGALVLKLGGQVEPSESEVDEMTDPAWHFVMTKDHVRGVVALRCGRQELMGTVSVSVPGGGLPIALGTGELTSAEGPQLAALLRRIADEVESKETPSGS